MTTILKTDAVTEALNKVIEAKGEDYIYPKHDVGCTYTDRDALDAVAPSCIVGWVIDAIDHEALEQIAEYEESHHQSFDVSELVDYGLEFDSASLVDALLVAQAVQDHGAPWAYAKRAYTLVLDEGVWRNEAEERVMGEWRIEQRRQRDAEEAQG